MGVKTIESELSHLSDEEYLVARSKLKRAASDPAAAKCWMITAQLMFPDNADIQYEAYALEKESGNAAQAAKILKNLIDHFKSTRGRDSDAPVRAKLSDELNKMVEALQGGADLGDEAALALLLSIFNRLDRETQQTVMMEAAAKRADTDMQAYGALLLKTFERFPDLIPMNGAKFLNSVVGKIKKSSHYQR
jgi:integrator complex subunit 10